ncbi:hypothetical protein [Cupriavidus necator]
MSFEHMESLPSAAHYLLEYDANSISDIMIANRTREMQNLLPHPLVVPSIELAKLIWEKHPSSLLGGASVLPVQVHRVGEPGPLQDVDAVIMHGHGNFGGSSLAYADKRSSDPDFANASWKEVSLRNVAAQLVASGVSVPIYLNACNSAAVRPATNFSFHGISEAIRPDGGQASMAQQLANELARLHHSTASPPVIGYVGEVTFRKTPGQPSSHRFVVTQSPAGTPLIAPLATAEVMFRYRQSPELHGKNQAQLDAYLQALAAQQRQAYEASNKALLARVQLANEQASAISTSASASVQRDEIRHVNLQGSASASQSPQLAQPLAPASRRPAPRAPHLRNPSSTTAPQGNSYESPPTAPPRMDLRNGPTSVEAQGYPYGYPSSTTAPQSYSYESPPTAPPRMDLRNGPTSVEAQGYPYGYPSSTTAPQGYSYESPPTAPPRMDLRNGPTSVEAQGYPYGYPSSTTAPQGYSYESPPTAPPRMDLRNGPTSVEAQGYPYGYPSSTTAPQGYSYESPPTAPPRMDLRNDDQSTNTVRPGEYRLPHRQAPNNINIRKTRSVGCSGCSIL